MESHTGQRAKESERERRGIGGGTSVAHGVAGDVELLEGVVGGEGVDEGHDVGLGLVVGHLARQVQLVQRALGRDQLYFVLV
jgi:hypothetical protein